MPLLVLCNPACGDRSARSFFESHVLPLLEKKGKTVDKLAFTEHVGHARAIVLDFLKAAEGAVTIVLGSGDGTLQEIVDALSSAEINPQVRFVLVPCGTANALYSSLFHASDEKELDDLAYKSRSLRAFINGSTTIPLDVAVTRLSPPPSIPKQPTTVIVSVVVVSTSFHAAILRDSESLRHDIPGLERFKVAAQKNASRWYNSRVKLFPAPSTGIVQVYEPSMKHFVSYQQSNEKNAVVNIEGPFIYFLSTVNVDRLEHSLRVTPLVSDIPPTEDSLDLMIVRPGRDPMFTGDSLEARSAFEAKIYAVFRGAYADGNHVNLRYREDGEIVSDGNGETVVEYIRCGGWEWLPDEDDVGAHQLCTDGVISLINRGGTAVCFASRKTGLTVYT